MNTSGMCVLPTPTPQHSFSYTDLSVGNCLTGNPAGSHVYEKPQIFSRRQGKYSQKSSQNFIEKHSESVQAL